MKLRIGILGVGNMGEALARGLQRSKDRGRYVITGSTHSIESARDSQKRLGFACHTDNRRLARESDVIVVCVKPHQVQGALKSMGSAGLGPGKLIISIAASVTTDVIARLTGGRAPVVRAMPNTPALIGAGVTALCQGAKASPKHMELADEIFRGVGPTVVIEERLMDAATGLSGCGPAYAYVIIEALSEAGVKVGLPRKTATLLAAQTLLGAARMVMERNVHPAALKDEVTTPAGCTIDGLMALEEGKLRVTLIKAVLAATKRSKSLAQGK